MSDDSSFNDSLHNDYENSIVYSVCCGLWYKTVVIVYSVWSVLLWNVSSKTLSFIQWTNLWQLIKQMHCWHTVDVERVTGLNIHGFSPMRFFAEILSQCIALATSVYYLPIAKNSQENFCSNLNNRENHECLVQQIFPHLRYVYIHILWYANDYSIINSWIVCTFLYDYC